MDILRFPNEVLGIMADFLVAESDLFHIAQTNRLFSLIAIPRLYRLNTRKPPEANILYKATRQGRADILHRAAQCGIYLGEVDLAELAARRGNTKVFDLLATHRVKKPLNADQLSRLVEGARMGRQVDMLNHLFDTFGVSIEPTLLSNYLMDAIQWRSTKLVQLWLDKGADPCSVSQQGETALVVAVKKGSSPVVNLLLERGAQVDDQSGGYAIIFEAVLPRRVRVLRALLKHGADPLVTTPHGLTPLQKALRHKNMAAARLLLQKTTHGANANTLLMAVQCKSAGLVRLHLEAGVEAVPPRDSSHASLLYVAAGLGELSVLNVLINSGVDIDLGHNLGYSPLHAAIQSGHTHAVSVLLRNGADVNKAGHDGFTPLHVAICTYNLEIIKLLIDHGAAINAIISFYNYTPLHLACVKGDVSIVTYLLEHGARIESLATRGGDSCLHLAATFGHQNVVRLLLDDPAGAALLNVQDYTGRTALFLAAKDGRSQVVEELLAREADANTANHFGTTPIVAAVREGHVKTVQVLLHARPELIESVDKEGQSLLYWAQQSGEEDLVTLIRRATGHTALEYSVVAKGQSTASEPDRWWHPKEISCSVCARRSRRQETVTKCSVCCGGEFLMCSECSSATSCLDASHSCEQVKLED